MYISEIQNKAPQKEGRTSLELKMYETLEKLGIPYEHVDNDPAHTMEECSQIDAVIGTEIRKSVFLCNQKKTSFFLLVMPANKPFDTAAFSKKLGVSHMSFAPEEKMKEHLGTTPGSASVAGVLCDLDDYVQVIIDKEVADEEWFGCNPGINTSHLKFKTVDLLKKFLPHTHHRARVVDL
ncbi:Ala-tRNA(Pro) deacylase [Aequitasia blattaphilus]|uniref:Prolyl-tRNA synthetase associated domain-containing protein n=1 Tax=Aequitasia blattaphilus TaxID=2949332 RepID=A0ABT1E5P8_9FIRM|nr:prolyl-tRNA synthetase associated domain-containing protein [Aequitasia blattaphilus]MCP1101144.1 prolyl-tRNA synthetase associated domain-containing protein [Aequitasia blattaphilus]MCR8613784.1 prolyl-tRNA synthetase associated domain-containing protein [Aequitasia blattaphilus]